MIAFDIPARPQKEINEEISLLKDQEKNKGRFGMPQSDSYESFQK